MTLDEKTAHPIDVHVGNRVRQRRKFMSLSQSELGNQIGLTFQQVQKYERGFNRVSASKLFEISRVLKVPTAYFFDGVFDAGSEDVSSLDSEQFVNGFLMTTEGIELAQAFPHIKNPKHRRKILDLVKALSEDSDS